MEDVSGEGASSFGRWPSRGHWTHLVKITWIALNEILWAGWSDRRQWDTGEISLTLFFFFLDALSLFVVGRGVEGEEKTPLELSGSHPAPLSPPPPPATTYVIRLGSIYHTSPRF